ncbi:hypothetical protein BGX27_009720 [Mortierella sp. AM989]|nr:hypothetical protein BGX27_009720 [Mortierella sp. AM989]
MAISTAPLQNETHAESSVGETTHHNEEHRKDNTGNTKGTATTTPSVPPASVWNLRKETMKDNVSGSEADAEKNVDSVTENIKGVSLDAKDDSKKSKKKKNHQQPIPSLDDTNVWPDPSASAEKETKQLPVTAAAPINKKDKGKWTPVTPNITHTTSTSGSKGHHDSHSRRRKSSAHGDSGKTSGHDSQAKNDNSAAANGGPSTVPTYGRRASVPSIFDEEPTQSQRNHGRQHSGRGRGSRSNGGRNARASVGNASHFYQQVGFQTEAEALRAFILQQM